MITDRFSSFFSLPSSPSFPPPPPLAHLRQRSQVWPEANPNSFFFFFLFPLFSPLDPTASEDPYTWSTAGAKEIKAMSFFPPFLFPLFFPSPFSLRQNVSQGSHSFLKLGCRTPCFFFFPPPFLFLPPPSIVSLRWG